MKTLMVAFWMMLAASTPRAQAPQAGLVVGSGNFFSPIVADLERAVSFYGDGLGLQVTGDPSNADDNPALRAMFGLPEARLRWTVARPPGMRTGVEIVEIKNANGSPVERRIQDPGGVTLLVQVRDIDAAFTKLKAVGAPVVTSGGKPVAVDFGSGNKGRSVIVKDPDGHFVAILQPDSPVETAAPNTANITGVRVRLTVNDAEQAMRLYCDVLGLMRRRPAGEFGSGPGVMNQFGIARGQSRAALAEVPNSGLVVEFIDFKDVERRPVQSRIQDPGSTRMQLQVRDINAAIAALKTAGGAVISTGAGTVDLPGRGGSTTKVAIVRDPNNLFLVLIGAPPAQGQNSNPDGPKQAMAPTGTLRVTFLGGNPTQGKVDSKTGAVTGPVKDLSDELARKLGVTVTVTPLNGVPAVLESLKARTADIGFAAIDPTRATEVDFSQPYILGWSSYLVPVGSTLHSVKDVDRAGIRVAANAGDSPDLFLTRNLKNATLAHFKSMDEVLAALVRGEIAGYATNRQRLLQIAAEDSRFRVLGDNFFAVEQAIAVSKGNTAALQFVNQFLDDAKASGFLRRVIDRAGLAGAADPAPPRAR
jgi:polar amino acid transport system substrate-binding protein